MLSKDIVHLLALNDNLEYGNQDIITKIKKKKNRKRTSRHKKTAKIFPRCFNLNIINLIIISNRYYDY